MNHPIIGDPWPETPDECSALGEAIGHDVYIRYTTYSGSDQPTGIIEIHRDPNGLVCMGAVNFDVPENPSTRARWTVESRNPLTLSPSLLCISCQHHGFIRQGAWVPAQSH